ncbi:hypothetical protein C0431_06585 [bacterium]|nr:hypothetical protein [bacterium]
MMITALLALSAPIYMERAVYPAASPIKDTEAIGGHGTSTNLPKPITKNSTKELISIIRQDSKLTIQITNHNKSNLWLRAADGNLIAWLEAKIGDTWKPIQYHYWITCGNSYHRINLPIGQQFTYEPKIPAGSLKTELRFALYALNEKPTYSKPLTTTIHPDILKLSPELTKESKLTTKWVTPTLVPKDMDF